MREVQGPGAAPVGAFQLTGQILRQDGLRGLFRGMTATLMREMPGYFCFFYAYEFSRELFTKEGQSKDDIGRVGTITSGALAGVALWTVVFPADVIKSRLQVTGSTAPIYQVGLSIFRKEGFFALYNGLTPTLLRTVPATGVLFFTYEYSKKYMKQIFD